MTDVPYQMTVGGAFVYVLENLGKRSRKRWTVALYNAVRPVFPVDPNTRVIMESQCILFLM